MNAQERIMMATLLADNGCWRRPLDAPRMPNGYDRISIAGHRDYIHRHAFVAWYGPIPEGKEVNHLCKQRDCANPAHLQAATHRENMLHGDTIVSAGAALTKCRPKGHPYTVENTKTKKNGSRECRECDRIRKRVTK